jgi:hypothetical protein
MLLLLLLLRGKIKIFLALPILLLRGISRNPGA